MAFNLRNQKGEVIFSPCILVENELHCMFAPQFTEHVRAYEGIKFLYTRDDTEESFHGIGRLDNSMFKITLEKVDSASASTQ